MSWTSASEQRDGQHRCVGPVFREYCQHNGRLIPVPRQKCSCGAWYDSAHRTSVEEAVEQEQG